MNVGDRVRVDIPDKTDTDHGLHGEHGEIIDIIEDDASEVTGRDVDDDLYRVRLTNQDRTVDFRARDLRPPITD